MALGVTRSEYSFKLRLFNVVYIINSRVSQFFITRMDGVLDTWDLLQQQNEPVLTVKVCDEPLYCVRTNENGKFVSCGSQLGATFLIEVSDNMVMSAKNDKPLLTAVRLHWESSILES